MTLERSSPIFNAYSPSNQYEDYMLVSAVLFNGAERERSRLDMPMMEHGEKL